MIDERDLTCPYCGETFSTTVDASMGSQNYIEDCYVCCRPIEVTLEVDVAGDILSISTRTDSE